MEGSRRDFLKLSGTCALGLGSLPVAKALAQDGRPRIFKIPEGLEGSRWAMVVDMKKCWEKGKDACKDCMEACRLVHNIPQIDTVKEEIKWIWEEHFENAFPGFGHQFLEMKDRPFMVMCNHCYNPPCVRVCPTKATFKREEDGIVLMDFHRCIGCRYCMAGCPFGARSFNFRDPAPYIAESELNIAFPRRERGVVEKCNFCAERLAVGQLPACVEACKCGALVFGDLDDPNSDVRKILATHFTIRRKAELGTEPNVFYIV
jgi:molybdopterin-containing oxidoreductase family iron-sulfur binding subunit